MMMKSMAEMFYPFCELIDLFLETQQIATIQKKAGKNESEMNLTKKPQGILMLISIISFLCQEICQFLLNYSKIFDK